jgi:HEAT repeat protein
MAERKALIVAPLYANVPGFSYLSGHSSLVPRLNKCLEEDGKYEINAELASKIVTRSAFREKLKYFFDTDGELLFYFYGHGCLSLGQGVFVTSDARENDEGVQMQQVVTLADNSSAREVVLIFDCCHAGASIPANKSSVPKANRAGRIILAACAEHQSGWETEIEEHKKMGVFSAHVLDGLEGAAKYGKAEVTGIRLGDYVISKFKSWKQTPIFEVSGGSSNRQFIITSGFPEEKSSQLTTEPTEPVDREWLNKYLDSVQDDFTQHMFPQEEITTEFAQKARVRYVELLVQEREQAKGTEQRDSAEPVKQAFPFSKLIDHKNTRFLIFGDGGGGKTTLLRKLASDIASKAQSDPSLPIPVFVKLNNFDATERSFDSLLKMVSDSASLGKHEFESIWRSSARKFLFLLDGYNEVGDAFQEACARALDKFVEVGTHYYLITSRPVVRAEELRKLLGLFTTVDVVHLEENQIKDFLARHGAAGLYAHMGDQLKGLAENPFILWALAQSSVASTKGSHPNTIGELYQNFIDHDIFVDREKKKNPSPTKYNYLLVKKPVLASLSMQMNSNGVTKVDEDKKLRKDMWNQLKNICTENEGLVDFEPYEFMPYDPPRYPSAKGFLDEVVHNDVLRRIGGTLEFMHQSVQDYFTASALVDLPIDKVISLVPQLRSRYIRQEGVIDKIVKLPDMGNFAESLVMFVGILDNADEFLLQLNSRNCLIAAKCACASKYISGDTKKQLVTSWRKLLKKENPILKCMGCLCFTYSQLANQEAVRILTDLIKNESNSDIVRNTAAKAIGKVGNSEHVESIVNEALSDQENWSKYSWGRILKSIDARIVVKQLYDSWRNTTKEVVYREKAKDLLGELDGKTVANAFANTSDEIIPQILTESLEVDFQYESNNYYADILKSLNIEKVVSGLFKRYIQSAHRKDYYKRIEFYLYYLDEKKLLIELERIAQENVSKGDHDKARIAEDLSNRYFPSSRGIFHASILTRMWKRARQKSKAEENILYEGLKKVELKKVQEKLSSDNINERIAAIRIIGESQSSFSLECLLNQLKNIEGANSRECEALIEVLNNFEDKAEILKHFKSNIGNPEYLHLLDFDIALSTGLDHSRVKPQLIQVLKDNDINIGSEDNIHIFSVTDGTWLIENFNDRKYFEIKKQDSHSLGLFDLNRKLNLIELTEILDDEVIPYLQGFIHEKEYKQIRQSALLALSRFKEFDIISIVKQLVDFEENTDVIVSCIAILGELGSERAISPLLKILQKVEVRSPSDYKDDLFSTEDSLYGSWGTISWVERICEALRKINDLGKVWKTYTSYSTKVRMKLK